MKKQRQFNVKVMKKSSRKNFKVYKPFASDSIQAYEWGVKQAQELHGEEGISEVMGEIKD